jgi:hypothetical protein
MKSFENVYNNSKNVAINEQQKAATADKARLIAAIKHEYGVKDFNSVREAEKASYKAMLNEMWNASTGLNEKGLAFINESAAVLTEKSTDEQIEKFYKKEVKANVDVILSCLCSGKESKVLIDIKHKVDEGTKKKLSNKFAKQWAYDILAKELGNRLKSVKF